MHITLIPISNHLDVLGEDVELDVVERIARCSSCGFKRISSVQIIYVGASEYALLGTDTKVKDDEVG